MTVILRLSLIVMLHLGLDPILWEQAKKDNPNPDNLLPVPMVGFSELHRRIKHQEQQCTCHQDRLDVSVLCLEIVLLILLVSGL